MRLLLIKLLVLFITNVSLNYNSAYAQKCNLKFDYRTEVGDNGGNIIIQYKDGRGDFTFKLYDWEDGINDFIKESFKASFEPGEEFLVFENLPPSVYTIQVFTPDGCQTSIGGIERITVSSKNDPNEIR